MNFVNTVFIASILKKKFSKPGVKNSSQFEVNNYSDAIQYVTSCALGDPFHSVPPDIYCTFPILGDDCDISFSTQYSKINSGSHCHLVNGKMSSLDSIVRLVPANDHPYVQSTCFSTLNAHLFADSENNPSFLVNLNQLSDHMNSVQPLLPNSFKDTLAIFLNSMAFQLRHLHKIDVRRHNSFEPYIAEFLFHLYLTSPLYKYVFNTDSLHSYGRVPGFGYDETRLNVSKLYCYLLPCDNNSLDMSAPAASFGLFMDRFHKYYFCHLFTKHMLFFRYTRFSLDAFSPNRTVSVEYVCMLPICLNALFFGRKIRSDFVTLFRKFYHPDIFISDPDYLGTDFYHATFLLNVIVGGVTVMRNNIDTNPFKFPARFIRMAMIMLRFVGSGVVSLHDFLYHLYLLFDIVPSNSDIPLPRLDDVHPYLFSSYGSSIDFVNCFPVAFEDYDFSSVLNPVSKSMRSDVKKSHSKVVTKNSSSSVVNDSNVANDFPLVDSKSTLPPLDGFTRVIPGAIGNDSIFHDIKEPVLVSNSDGHSLRSGTGKSSSNPIVIPESLSHSTVVSSGVAIVSPPSNKVKKSK